MNGYINAGYAVWREMIADIISMEAIIDICQLRITKKMVQDLYEQMVYGNPGAKTAVESGAKLVLRGTARLERVSFDRITSRMC